MIFFNSLKININRILSTFLGLSTNLHYRKDDISLIQRTVNRNSSSAEYIFQNEDFAYNLEETVVIIYSVNPVYNRWHPYDIFPMTRKYITNRLHHQKFVKISIYDTSGYFPYIKFIKTKEMTIVNLNYIPLFDDRES